MSYETVKRLAGLGIVVLILIFAAEYTKSVQEARNDRYIDAF